jgi:hypothetical protein
MARPTLRERKRMSKSISEMSEEELLAELHRLESIKVPKSPTPKAPQNRKVADADKAAKASKRAPWKQLLDLD